MSTEKQRQHWRRYYRENRDTILARRKDYRQKKRDGLLPKKEPKETQANGKRQALREWAIKRLGGCCRGCGITEELTFHHLNPKNKKAKISDLLNKDKEILAKELGKCVLLCEECHGREHGRLYG
jgi:5-methylcytosine-specific restriction endonuclease McrA